MPKQLTARQFAVYQRHKRARKQNRYPVPRVDWPTIYDAMIVDGEYAVRVELSTVLHNEAIKLIRLAHPSIHPDFVAIGQRVIAENQGLLKRLADA